MALTIAEQLEILKRNVQPPSNLLRDVVHQVAQNEGLDFYNNYKTFDGATFIDAQQYVTKMLRIIAQVIGNNENTIKALERLVITLYSVSGDFATVQSATDSQWATFIQNNMINAFEIISLVTRAEKTEYDGLP